MKRSKQPNCCLAVDIGNSEIHMAPFYGQRRGAVSRLRTGLSRQQLTKKVLRLLKRKNYRLVRQAIICSVVPEKTRILEKILRRHIFEKVIVVGRDLSVPLKNRYRHPRQVGQDRLVGAFAAVELYRCPVIVIDLGTAITLDVVSHRREYLGGLIIPGLKLSTASLNRHTALLPLVEIRKPTQIIGRDTQSSILSGIFYGYGVMIDGLINLLKKQVRGQPQVIMTGGYCDLMRNFFRREVIIEHDLVLKGLNLLFHRTAQK